MCSIPTELKIVTFKSLGMVFPLEVLFSSLKMLVILVTISRLDIFGKVLKTKSIQNVRKIHMKARRKKKSPMRWTSSFLSCKTSVMLTT